MSFAYRALYLVGFTPWEKMVLVPAADQIRDMFDRETAERQPMPRRALDLGCGSGIWAVELASRGWDVTGVDFVPKALQRARKRASRAGVDLRLVRGDVTDLGSAGVGSGYDLLVDFGCFHDELTDEQRGAEGREVTAVAAPARRRCCRALLRAAVYRCRVGPAATTSARPFPTGRSSPRSRWT